MEVLPDFPDHRINDPLRQAELAVYRELQASEAEGTALYEVRPALNYTELDAVVWLIGWDVSPYRSRGRLPHRARGAVSADARRHGMPSWIHPQAMLGWDDGATQMVASAGPGRTALSVHGPGGDLP